jgi:hypothetical protein
MGVKWRNKSPEDKKRIKNFYLRFYRNFNCERCPILLAKDMINYEEADNLFIGKNRFDGCNMCTQFKELTKDHDGSSCPCVAFGQEKAYKGLKQLLKRWKLIK